LLDLAGCGTDAAIVCTDGGDVLELRFAGTPLVEQARTHLGHFAGAIRVAGCPGNGGEAHALVATDRGQIFAFTLRTATRAMLRVGDFASVVDIAAFFDPGDGHTHVVIAQADGTITSVELTPRADAILRRTPLGRIPHVTRLFAYGMPRDVHFPHRV